MGIDNVYTHRYCHGMENLRAYLNSLPVEDQAAYAKQCGTTIGYLRKALSKGCRLDGALCRLLDENSKGAVPRSSLRPDIWPAKEDKRKARIAA